VLAKYLPEKNKQVERSLYHCLESRFDSAGPTDCGRSPGRQFGTTYIFTNYLTKVSSDWQTRIGFGTSVSWPGDIGADQSAGVTGQVLKQPYSIGYVELAYAIENKVSYAVVQNEAGNFITPSIESTNKAAEG